MSTPVIWACLFAWLSVGFFTPFYLFYRQLGYISLGDLVGCFVVSLAGPIGAAVVLMFCADDIILFRKRPR